MRHRLSLLLLGALPACALHLVAPEPDVRTLQPVEPAAETSFIAAVARLPLMQLAGIVEHYALAPVQRTGDAGPVHWALDIARGVYYLHRRCSIGAGRDGVGSVRPALLGWTGGRQRQRVGSGCPSRPSDDMITPLSLLFPQCNET